MRCHVRAVGRILPVADLGLEVLQGVRDTSSYQLLMTVTLARNPCGSDGRQEQAHQHADDRDDHEHLDEREAEARVRRIELWIAK